MPYGVGEEDPTAVNLRLASKPKKKICVIKIYSH